MLQMNFDNNQFFVVVYPGLLGVQKNGVKKWIRVEDESGYCFKLLKTKIKAAGGAEGLYRFLESHQDFGSCFSKKILNYAFDEMREAKV